MSNVISAISWKNSQGVFGGDIANWKELGGMDHPIILVVPGKNTGAFKRFPWAISFIAQGATARQWGIKSIKIDGLPPKDEDYPYYQVFFYVTKGKPAGHAKAFIDFALSKKVDRYLECGLLLDLFAS